MRTYSSWECVLFIEDYKRVTDWKINFVGLWIMLNETHSTNYWARSPHRYYLVKANHPSRSAYRVKELNNQLTNTRNHSLLHFLSLVHCARQRAFNLKKYYYVLYIYKHSFFRYLQQKGWS
jgi:hypothetical protein